MIETYCSLGLNMSIRKQRKELIFDEKAKLLKDSNDGAKEKVLTEKYGVSRKQVYNVVQNKRVIMENAHNDLSSDRKRLKSGECNDRIDKALWIWFQEALSVQLPVSGPILQEKALHLLQR